MSALNDVTNPYRPPRDRPDPVPPQRGDSSKIDRVAFAAWPLALVSNMIVPLFFGLDFTYEQGRAGMLVATVLFLLAGWGLCYVKPNAARRLIAGSTLTAISQFFPILQIFAGVVAIGIADRMGLSRESTDGNLAQVSELGGFIMTVVVGVILLTVAGAIGVGFALVMPLSWFTPNSRPGPAAVHSTASPTSRIPPEDQSGARKPAL